MEYNFNKIEKKWQIYWKKKKIFNKKILYKKKKYYILNMFPYPSGEGLHVGHPIGYIASDIYARYKNSQGENVINPIGFDSFGLPTEQYSIQTGIHPNIMTKINIKRYKIQLLRLGISFDWDRELNTSDSTYFKWTQWMFIKMFNSWYDKKLEKARSIKILINEFNFNGNRNINAFSTFKKRFSADEWKKKKNFEKEKILQNYRIAFLSKRSVNWCPKLGTVLANDEIKENLSKRGGYPVYKKRMLQWSLRISAYSERLLNGLNKVNYPDNLKKSQKSWIGKESGIKIFFSLEKNEKIKLEIFTIKPYMLFGVTFIIIPLGSYFLERKKITNIVDKQYINDVKKYLLNFSLKEKEISGIFTGNYVLHPLTKKKIPVYISSFIKDDYNLNSIMCVPAHEIKSYKFAKKFGIKILEVLSIKSSEKIFCINSSFLNGLNLKNSFFFIKKILLNKNFGKKSISFKLKDAVFSRQRYWGEPIPIYYENNIPKTINKLPLLLPYMDISHNEINSPLTRAKFWAWDKKNKKIVYTNLINKKTIFPLETNTMPSWAGSSWYYFRYMDPKNKNFFLNKRKENYWKNVDLYVGGIEHATGHLIYARFWHKFLKDYGLVNSEEPFKKIINQGMILVKSAIIYRNKKKKYYISYSLLNLKKKNDFQKINIDIKYIKNKNEVDIEKIKTWRSELNNSKFILDNGKFTCNRILEKMSKSKYNVINPDFIYNKYGADTFRMYEMFLGPLEKSKIWNIKNIDGIYNFLKKFWNFFHKKGKFYVDENYPSKEELEILYKTIKKIKNSLESFSFNIPISEFMIFLNKLIRMKCYKRQILEPITILFSFYAPHISEEIWYKLGKKKSIYFANFPKNNLNSLLEKYFNYPVTFNGKFRFKIKFKKSEPIQKIEKKLLNNEKIILFLKNKKPKKIFIILNKIINIVF
ncbi:MAG: leucine--tRNA ligase [Candidatus Karelsulcia muelleri]